MHVLLPADTFIVVNKTLLSDNDRNLLIMLYQPLIGNTSISLYFSLWSYLDKLEIMSNEWTHHHLMSSLKIRLDEIIIAREKLEAIGLIKTYYKETKNYKNFIYELYSPMSSHEFLTNPILSTLLYNNIGQTEYNRTIKYFEKAKIDLNGYTDITSSFSEVFEIKGQTNYEIISDDISKTNKRKLEIVTNIDLNDIFSNIPKEILDHKKVTKETKELIYNLSFIYGFDNISLGQIIDNSIIDRKINHDLLRENSKKYFKFENEGKLPNIIYKESPEYVKNMDESSESKQIYTFKTTTPYEYLIIKQNGGKPTQTELKLIEHLIVDLQLDPFVVNVLIDYVLKVNKNKLTKSFTEAVASQWKISNIDTVEKAMEIARQEYNKAGSKKRYYNKKDEIKPVWFDDDIKENKVSDEERLELEAMLKEFK